MSTHDHRVDDFTSSDGRTFHADPHGTYHMGTSASCELCKVKKLRALRRYMEASPPALPCDLRTEREQLRALNRLLERERAPIWPFVFVGLVGVLALIGLGDVVGFIRQ